MTDTRKVWVRFLKESRERGKTFSQLDAGCIAWNLYMLVRCSFTIANMAAKASTYTSGSSVDSLAAINAKLVADVRATIKSLALVAPLSPEWQEMARKMARLARITETVRSAREP